MRRAAEVNSKAPANVMRFAGEEFDADTGLYHLRARQYDPTTARFTAQDPIGAELTAPFGSAYPYADNRPTVLVDPSGESAIGELQDPSHPSVFLALGDLGYPTEADARRYHNRAVLFCIQNPWTYDCLGASERCRVNHATMRGALSPVTRRASSPTLVHVSIQVSITRVTIHARTRRTAQ